MVRSKRVQKPSRTLADVKALAKARAKHMVRISIIAIDSCKVTIRINKPIRI